MLRVLLNLIPFLLAAAAPVAEEGERKNGVILFVGDGMGVSTVTAARIFDGQNKGLVGEENLLAFEHFPHLALVKTYNVDAQVSDSAGTMTARVTGHRARAGVLAWDPKPHAGIAQVPRSTNSSRCWRKRNNGVSEPASFPPRASPMPCRRGRPGLCHRTGGGQRGRRYGSA